MEQLIELTNVRKSYGSTVAIDNISLQIPPGRIVGVIGPNGAGKTTLLHALTGLINYEGKINILGIEPKQNRPALMEQTGVIHDISVLPSWMIVKQVLSFHESLHTGFDRQRCESLLSKTDITLDRKVKQLSKGMKTQLHLSLVLATDTKLLVLDEPTHGLDILFRKQLYSSVLEDFFDQNKTILIATHQVEEVEHILSDVIFISRGKLVLYSSIEELQERYIQVIAPNDQAESIRALKPLVELNLIGKKLFLLENVAGADLQKYGEVRTPGIADIFVATMGGDA